MTWRRDIDQWFIAEVLTHAPAFRAYAKRLCGEVQEAEDLVQEAYARTLGVEDWRAIDNAKAFVFRVMHNLAVAKLRREKIVAIEHIPDVETLGAADPSPDAFAQAAARQELARVEAVIRALPGACRQVVTLRKIYDLAPVEIAARLNITVSTVEKHLTKGMRLVAAALADAPAPETQNTDTRWPTKKTLGEP